VPDPIPTATTSSISVTEDIAESWNLSWSDPEGDSLTYHKVSDPSKWTLSINSDWSYTYTPNANEFWTDSFQYKVNDWSADSTVQTVTVNIDAVNDAHSISSPTLDSKTDTSINTVPWDFTDADWVQNKTVKLYSDSWLTALVWTNANGDFSGLTADTPYYAVTTWEAYNAEASSWETVYSTKTELRTNAELDRTPDDFSFGILTNQDMGVIVDADLFTVSWLSDWVEIDLSLDYWWYKIQRDWNWWERQPTDSVSKVKNWDIISVRHRTSAGHWSEVRTNVSLWNKSAAFVSITHN
jgi:hypothetical protein